MLLLFLERRFAEDAAAGTGAADGT